MCASTSARNSAGACSDPESAAAFDFMVAPHLMDGSIEFPAAVRDPVIRAKEAQAAAAAAAASGDAGRGGRGGRGGFGGGGGFF